AAALGRAAAAQPGAGLASRAGRPEPALVRRGRGAGDLRRSARRSERGRGRGPARRPGGDRRLDGRPRLRARGGLITTLEERHIGRRLPAEQIDTTTPGGKLILLIFGAYAEFERNLIRVRTNDSQISAAG